MAIFLLVTYLNIAFCRFGYFYVLPLTAPTAVATPNPTIPPSTIKAHPLDLCAVTFGDYNVPNLAYILIFV